MNTWDQAVKQLKNLTRDRMDFKVKTTQDTNKLLVEARGNMNRYKNYTQKKYSKGYEVHNVQNPRELGVGNDLPHLKWKDGKSLGHIFYEKPN